MPLDDISEHRRLRLEALSEKFGGKAALGRLLGYVDGAFVGQMIRGVRPITEKTVEQAEKLPGATNWFNAAKAKSSAVSEFEAGLPDHVHGLVVELGSALLTIDELRRNAIAELLSGLAKRPSDAQAIAGHISALLYSKGKLRA